MARVRAVADAAAAAGRKLVVSGRAMHRVIRVAKDPGYLPEEFSALDHEYFSHLEPSEVVLLCTGSQGEQRAAMARIAEDEHPAIKMGRGDVVIFSSRPIPGNEKSISKIQNGLTLLGCDVITDSDQLVHVTGHPRREELRQMYEWLKPKVAIPMHGEARHLKEHAKLAEASGVPNVQAFVDGEIIRIAPGPVMAIDEAPTGRLFRDGKLIVPGNEGPVKERRKLSAVGIVVVAIALDKRGDVVADPEVVLDGVPTKTLDGSLMEDVVYDAVDGTLDSIPPKRRQDEERVREAVRRAVRAAVDQAWGKKPIVKVLICLV